MDSTALILNLDQNNPMPVYEQILKQIIQLIDMGTLRAGTHLPPTRTLARKLDVNRSTVYRAYQELWAQGYIKSRPGSFSTVRHRSVSAAGKDRKHAGILSWDKLSTPRSRDIYKTYLSHVNKYPEIDPSRVIALTDLAADRQLCPVEDFRKCVREVLLRKGSEILSYGEPAGYGPLRETIARHMQVHGVSVRPEEILITDDAQHAIELALKLLAVSGTRSRSKLLPTGWAFRFSGFMVRICLRFP